MTPDSTPRLVTAWKALSDTLPVNKCESLVVIRLGALGFTSGSHFCFVCQRRVWF